MFGSVPAFKSRSQTAKVSIRGIILRMARPRILPGMVTRIVIISDTGVQLPLWFQWLPCQLLWHPTRFSNYWLGELKEVATLCVGWTTPK